MFVEQRGQRQLVEDEDDDRRVCRDRAMHRAAVRREKDLRGVAVHQEVQWRENAQRRDPGDDLACAGSARVCHRSEQAKRRTDNEDERVARRQEVTRYRQRDPGHEDRTNVKWIARRTRSPIAPAASSTSTSSAGTQTVSANVRASISVAPEREDTKKPPFRPSKSKIG